MVMRGVEKAGASIVTSTLLGVLKDNEDLRNSNFVSRSQFRVFHIEGLKEGRAAFYPRGEADELKSSEALFQPEM
jgi:hypothetical protein